MRIDRLPRPVAVICDVGPAHGVGHVMRCLALGEELVRRGLTPVFLADLATVDFARRRVEERGIAWRAAAPDDLLRAVDELRPEAVVVDSYHLPRGLYAALRARARTLAFADGDPAGVDGDLVLDQNVGAETDYWPLPAGAERLAGLRYALMRQEILDHRPASPVRSDESTPLRLFVFAGGTDAYAAAPVLTRAALATSRPLSLRVVGATSELRAQLSRIEAGPSQQIVVLEPTDHLAGEVVAADLVLAAAGTSAWELLCLGAACALVCVAENQARAYARLGVDQTIAPLGHLEALREDTTPASGVLDLLLTRADERARLRRTGHDLVDGLGRVRVVDTLLRRSSVPPTD